MRGPSNGSIVRCRKLVSCRRRGGVDTMRVHKPGANAKPRHSVVGVVALGSQNRTVASTVERQVLGLSDLVYWITCD